MTEREAEAGAPANGKTPEKSNRKGRGRAFLIFFIVLAIAAVVAVLWWLHSRQFENTDDAQVDAHLNPVTSRIDGTIVKVYVDDNQTVKVGDPLVDLDPRDLQASLSQSLAQLAQARSMVIAERPNVPITEVENVSNISGGEADVANAEAVLAAAERDRDSSAAKVAEAEANEAEAQSDLTRYKKLIAKEEVSQREYDQVATAAKARTASLNSAKAALLSSERAVDGRKAQLVQVKTRLAQYKRNAPQMVAIRKAAVRSNQASAQSSEAAVESARLKLSYTRIAAPVAGIIMKRSGEVGAHVAAGQQLMQIAQIDDVWVTANFKETQLRRIHPGQSVSIHVDALDENFEGTVESIGGSTGSIASVLPPENATGNYVKVVQRIPVRLRFKKHQQHLERLRPGMSVEPDVRVGS